MDTGITCRNLPVLFQDSTVHFLWSSQDKVQSLKRPPQSLAAPRQVFLRGSHGWGVDFDPMYSSAINRSKWPHLLLSSITAFRQQLARSNSFLWYLMIRGQVHYTWFCSPTNKQILKITQPDNADSYEASERLRWISISLTSSSFSGLAAKWVWVCWFLMDWRQSF